MGEDIPKLGNEEYDNKDIETATIAAKVPTLNTEVAINVNNLTETSTFKTMLTSIQIQDEVPEFGIEEFDYNFDEDITNMQMNSTTPDDGLTDGSNLVTEDINKLEVNFEDSKEMPNFSEASPGKYLITFAITKRLFS